MTWMQRLKRLFNIDVVVAKSKWSGQAICDNPVKQLFSFQRCLIRSHKDNNSPGASAIVGYCKTSIYSPIYPVELHIWSAPVLGEPVSVLGKEKLQSSIRLLVGFVSPGSSWKSAHSRPYHLDGLPIVATDGTHRFPGIQALPFVPLPSFLTYQQRGWQFSGKVLAVELGALGHRVDFGDLSPVQPNRYRTLAGHMYRTVDPKGSIPGQSCADY